MLPKAENRYFAAITHAKSVIALVYMIDRIRSPINTL